MMTRNLQMQSYIYEKKQLYGSQSEKCEKLQSEKKTINKKMSRVHQDNVSCLMFNVMFNHCSITGKATFNRLLSSCFILVSYSEELIENPNDSC